MHPDEGPQRAGAPAPGWREHLKQRVRRLRRPAWLGTVRRTRPLSNTWGFDRGTPVDRYYIERFLAEHRQDIRGRALEVKNRTYLDRFGSGVERCDVLDVDGGNSQATLIADLAGSDELPSDVFDCFVLTQTLQFIFNMRAAVANTYRLLRPGGVVLVTVPSISRLAPRYGLEGDYWRFTPASCRTLFAEHFGAEQVTVRSHGNVLTAIAFLTGMACEELTRRELDAHDEYFPLIVSVRAVKPDSASRAT